MDYIYKPKQSQANLRKIGIDSQFPSFKKEKRELIPNPNNFCSKGIIFPVCWARMPTNLTCFPMLFADELKKHLELLSKHQPGWINSCEVDNKPYIRVSKDADMTRVLGRLQKLIEST